MKTLALFFICFSAICQKMYVNTDNLILRDIPEKNYTVMIILHAPAEVNISHTEMYYDNNKEVNAKFYQVEFEYFDSTHNTKTSSSGWVSKQFLSKNYDEINLKYKTNKKLYTDVNLISYVGDADSDPNRFNRYAFAYPLYKGGDPAIKKAIDVRKLNPSKYTKSPTGVCYYIDKEGKMVVVEKSLCH